MYAGTANAYGVTDAKDMLIRISTYVPQLWRMVTGAAYVLGLLFMFKALYHLKIYGEARTMMSSQTSMKQPIMYIFVGAALMYYPTMRETLMTTTFGYDSPLKYSSWDGPNTMQGYSTDAIFYVVQFIGLLAFIRGWVLLSHTAGQGGAQPGQFGKAMTHIFGGTLAMNIVGTINVLQKTLGVNFGV